MLTGTSMKTTETDNAALAGGRRTMNESLRTLLELQEVDSQIIFLRDAREKRPRELESDRRRLEEKKRLLEGLAQEIKRIKMESDRRELDLKHNEAEVEKLRIALNQAKSNQEYQILKEQIARLEEQDSKIEEEVLKRLGEVDGLERAKRSAEEELRAVEADFKLKVEELNRVLKGLEEQLGGLESRRQGAVKKVPTEHLSLYERVLKRQRDSALARVENQVCMGCFMGITPQTINLLMQDRELIQCRNCLRILYLD
jgi:predicted  nucleic acid-binding Zn-ribbon protein